MSCTTYRYLIQQRFDEDLSSDDAGDLDEHIERCDSCNKFDHQLDQMIGGTAKFEDFGPLMKGELKPTPTGTGGPKTVIVK